MACEKPSATVDRKPQAPEAEWQTCSWSSEREDDDARCADVLVPVDYAQPSDDRFLLRVKHRPARQPARAALFLLAGGPGDAATESAESLSHAVYEQRADLEIFAIDQRGTGGSERLACAGSLDVAQGLRACVTSLEKTHGDHLAAMTTTHAAHDLHTIMQSFVPQDRKVFLYGGSYGTYLAQRFLQLFPERIAGVVLEGVASPQKPFDGYDAGMNEVAGALMQLCASDLNCASHFEGDPWQVANATVASLDSGHCPSVSWSAASARTLLGNLLVYTELQNLIPAIVARLTRCQETDVASLRHLLSAFEGLAGDGGGASDLLGVHVGLSELVTRPMPRKQLTDALTGYAMVTGLEASLSAFQAEWPTYEPDELEGRWSRYDGPLLILHGALDPATPLTRAREVASHFTAPQQSLIVFPYAAHSVTGNTATATGDDCAQGLLLSFLAHPDRALDTRCVEDVLPLSFDGKPDLVRFLLGAATAWPENG